MVDKNREDKLLRNEVHREHDSSTYLLSQSLSSCYGPELPHPSDYLLPSDNKNNSTLDESLDHHISRLLKSYSIDMHHGFLPAVDPLPQLSLSSKFACWETIMIDLTRFLHAKNIRSAILSRLQVIDIEQDDLLDERELQRALLILAMLSHAFVWGENPVSTFIPSCLAIPWVTLTTRAGIPPVLIHSLIALSNWKRFDVDQPIELGNIAMLNCFLSGVDEANFYLVIIELEYRGAKALKHMLRAQYFANNGRIQELINELKSIHSIQKSMLMALSKMYNEVDPYIFYNRVRHFLAGWKGNPLLPHGILYEGVCEKPQFLHGASAAQSALIAAFDVFFDIKHDSGHTHEFISEMRFYMPIKHRRFLERLGSEKYTIKDFVKKLTSIEHKQQDNDLINVYNSCIDELIAFRNKHIQIVALYILAQMHGNVNEKEETASSARGTGGTILMPFLKSCRDETIIQRIN